MLAVAAALLLATCRSAPPPRLRVTVVGIDGATWRVVDPLVARGELPNLGRLLAHGVRAPLRSQVPLVSPAVWTTIASGVSRERHGITTFTVAGGRLARSTDRRVHTLWTVASAAGLRSAVIGWWATYPAEAINGVVISERALKVRDEDVRALGGGHHLAADQARLVSPAGTLDIVSDLLFAAPDVSPDPDDASRVVPRMQAEDAAVVRSLARLRAREGPYDLEMILLRGVDPVSHYFWRFHEPDAAVYSDAERPGRDELAAVGDPVEAHYRFVDKLLGELSLNAAPDRVVIVVSDHGFEAGRQSFRGGSLSGTHEGEAAIDGIFIVTGGPARSGVRLEHASILDVAPTVLQLLGLPVAEDLEGRVLAEAVDPAWTASHPLRHVASYGAVAHAPTAATGVPGVDERLRRELRALGYVQ